jgi:hypothetical protein
VEIGQGTNWSIPHSITAHRIDTDKKGGNCIVYDVVYHPKTIRLAEEDGRLKDMVIKTAMDGIESRFTIHTFDRQTIKFPKMTFKGSVHRSMIREKKGESPSERSNQAYVNGEVPTAIESLAKTFEHEQKQAQGGGTPASPPTEPAHQPKFTIVHRGAFDMLDFRLAPDAEGAHRSRPKDLVVTVYLPLCSSARGVELDITAEQLSVHCASPGPYRLETALPYPVDQDKGTATFDKSKKALIITLPLLPPPAAEPAVRQRPPGGVGIEELPDSAAEAGDAPAPTPAVGTGPVAVAAASPASAVALSGAQGPAASAEPKRVVELSDAGAGTNAGVGLDAGAGSGALVGAGPKVVELIDTAASVEATGADSLSRAPTEGARSCTSPNAELAYSLSQTSETVTVILDVEAVATAELGYEEHAFGPLVSHSCTLTFEAPLDGFVEVNQLVLKFDGALEPDQCSVDVGPKNTVVVLQKAAPAPWRRVMVGPSATSLTERLFPAFEASDANAGVWSTEDTEVDVVVVNKTGSSFQANITTTASSATAPTATATATSSAAAAAAAAAVGPPSGQLPFEAAAAFAGSRADYVYRSGTEGLGYYYDWAGVAAIQARKVDPSALPGLQNAFLKPATEPSAPASDGARASPGDIGGVGKGRKSVSWGENDTQEPPKLVELDDGDDGDGDGDGGDGDGVGDVGDEIDETRAVNEAALKAFSGENVAYPGLGQSRLDLYAKAVDKQKEERDAAKAAAAAEAAPKPESVLHNSLIDELE